MSLDGFLKKQKKQKQKSTCVGLCKSSTCTRLYLPLTLCLSTQEAGQVSQPQWPEDGAEWSDAEDGTNMDCGLLQAMAEEDEEINVYNEETFGMGV